MKRYFEHKENTTEKFWQIELDKFHHAYKHIVTSGKIGSDGNQKSYIFGTEKAMLEDINTRVSEKINSGYKEILKGTEKTQRWFDRLTVKMFDIYKEAILKRPLKKYKYLELHWSGQGFALDLNTEPEKSCWEYVENGDWHNEEDTSITSVYSDLENIPEYEYDEEEDCEYEVEFERDEFPEDSNDCFHLECFLIYVGLGLTALKIKEDKKLKKYLTHLEKLSFFSVNPDLRLLTSYSLDDSIKQKVVECLANNPKYRKFILKMWGKNQNEITSYLTNAFFTEQLKKRK